MGDPASPPILPWVTDFSSEIDLSSDSQTTGRILEPWRDLSKVSFSYAQCHLLPLLNFPSL